MLLLLRGAWHCPCPQQLLCAVLCCPSSPLQLQALHGPQVVELLQRMPQQSAQLVEAIDIESLSRLELEGLARKLTSAPLQERRSDFCLELLAQLCRALLQPAPGWLVASQSNPTTRPGLAWFRVQADLVAVPDEQAGRLAGVVANHSMSVDGRDYRLRIAGTGVCSVCARPGCCLC